jgi:hypothetical protein
MEFFSSLEALAKTDVSEAPWIKKNVEALKGLGCMELLRKVSTNANHLGDALIFSELPQGWQVLTRDRAFATLQQLHRPNHRVFYVRAPRFPSGAPCEVRLLSSHEGEAMEGVLVDVSATGAAIRANQALPRGSEISLACEAFDSLRSGFVVDAVEEPDGQRLLRISFKRVRKRVASEPSGSSEARGRTA